MTFYSFMMKNYLGADSFEGYPARTMKDEKGRFPRNGKRKFKAWHDILHAFLVRDGAGVSALSAFERCWEEYEYQERIRLGMSLQKNGG